jgi:hypothetical protein
MIKNKYFAKVEVIDRIRAFKFKKLLRFNDREWRNIFLLDNGAS